MIKAIFHSGMCNTMVKDRGKLNIPEEFCLHIGIYFFILSLHSNGAHTKVIGVCISVVRVFMKKVHFMDSYMKAKL